MIITREHLERTLAQIRDHLAKADWDAAAVYAREIQWILGSDALEPKHASRGTQRGLQRTEGLGLSEEGILHLTQLDMYLRRRDREKSLRSVDYLLDNW
jgi:hypothetical protein